MFYERILKFIEKNVKVNVQGAPEEICFYEKH